ncbi:MAG: DUF2092 domain-containing protein [Flavobacteriaceae bacterium]
MKKRIILYSLLSALFFVSCNSSGDGEYDTRAIESLDKLTETVGDLNSLSYTVDSYSVSKEGEENSKLSDVYLRDHNKMFIKNSGTKGNKSFWYNGETFSYFLFDKNEYDILNAPDNTLKVIDSINANYGIYFPAADFLYPTLTDDMITSYDQILFFGDEKIEDIDCISIEASNEEYIVQIWINKELNLPYKMTIISKVNENEYYEAVYSNWRINPKLPDVMFEFKELEGSERKKFALINKTE